MAAVRHVFLGWLLACVFAAQAAEVTVHTERVIQSAIGGLGYDTSPLWWRDANRQKGLTRQQIAGSLAKRWLEQRPGFARVAVCPKWWEPDEGHQTWENEAMVSLRRHLDLLKQTQSDVYLSLSWKNGNPAWLGGGDRIGDPALQARYARCIGDGMEHLFKQRGYTNIRYLSICVDFSAKDEPPEAPSVAPLLKAVAQELANAGLGDKVELVAADEPAVDDALPPHLRWAAETLDPVLGAYGAACFSSLAQPELTGLYSRMFDVAHTAGKSLLVPAVGSSADARAALENPDGDRAAYGLTLARHAIAGLNAGVHAMAARGFVDLISPEDSFRYRTTGLMRGVSENLAPKPEYGAWALMVRHFGKGTRLFATESDHPAIAALAGRYGGDGPFVLALLNDSDDDQSVRLSLDGADLPGQFLRSRVFPPREEVTGLPDEWPPVAQAIEGDTEELRVDVPSHSLAVVTDELGEKPAADDWEASVTRLGATDWIEWPRHPDKNVVFYRILADGEPVASTVATRWLHENGGKTLSYEVEAVPFAGAPSDPVECRESQDGWMQTSDPCDDLGKTAAHSENVVINVDPTRPGMGAKAIGRNKAGSAWIVYECPVLRFARIVTTHNDSDRARVNFFAAEDLDGPWDKLEQFVVAQRSLGTAGWREVVYALPDLPDSMGFLKIEFDDKEKADDPQIDQVDLWQEH